MLLQLCLASPPTGTVPPLELQYAEEVPPRCRFHHPRGRLFHPRPLARRAVLRRVRP